MSSAQPPATVVDEPLPDESVPDGGPQSDNDNHPADTGGGVVVDPDAPKIPLTAVIDDPSLFETYECSRNSILICHIPSSATLQFSSCISNSAIESHFDHDGDYLGSCR